MIDAFILPVPCDSPRLLKMGNCREIGEPELSAQGTLGTQAAHRLRLRVALANVRESDKVWAKPLSLC